MQTNCVDPVSVAKIPSNATGGPYFGAVAYAPCKPSGFTPYLLPESHPIPQGVLTCGNPFGAVPYASCNPTVCLLSEYLIMSQGVLTCEIPWRGGLCTMQTFWVYPVSVTRIHRGSLLVWNPLARWRMYHANQLDSPCVCCRNLS